MRRLLIRGTIFAAPFILVAAFVVAVDPFNYFGLSHLVTDQVKDETAGKLHYALWKVQGFKRAPVRRILLGDSRMAGFSTSAIRALSGEDYFNFAYGGGTLVEAIATYRLAASVTRLDAVYLEMGLINFNAYQNVNRVAEVDAIGASPLMYLSNRLVVRAAFLAGYVAWTGNKVDIESPAMDRDAFWRFQIDEALPQLLHRYAYPDDVAKGLQELAEDCRRNGTKLVIVIPPTHVDVQEQVHALGRSAEEARFKEFAASLGPVYDFDYENALTRDRERFSDPYHLWDNDELIRDIWSDRQVWARLVARGAGEYRLP